MSDGKEAAPIRLKKPREIKKRKRRKLFGGVGKEGEEEKVDNSPIPKYVSIDYIQRLLAHEQRGVDVPVSESEGSSSEISESSGDSSVIPPGSDLSDISDSERSEASLDGSVVPGDGSAPLSVVPPPLIAAPVVGSVNPIDQAFNHVNALTSTLASNQNLNVPETPETVNPVGAAFDYAESLASTLAESDDNETPETINPVGAAFDYAESLASTLAKSVDNETPETINPVGAAFDYAESLASTLAKSVDNETPETVNPVGEAFDYAESLASTLAKSVDNETTYSNPTGEAIDYAKSLASMLAESVDIGPPAPAPGTVPRTLFDLSPPPSEFPPFPKFEFNPADKLKNFLDSWWSEEDDETKYEVEEYVTALGSDTKQNLRSTIYDENGTVAAAQPVPNAAPYQHQWKTPAPPVVAQSA
jgi:hypothetical protein